jgi:acyl carrier protein
MTPKETEARLRAVLVKTSKATPETVAAVGPDDDLIEALGLDSLQGLRVLAALEKDFEIRFEDARLGELRTLRALLDAIREARKERAS